MSRKRFFAIAAAVLAAGGLFCLQYAWPRSWTKIVGTEDAPNRIYGQLVAIGDGEGTYQIDDAKAGDPAFDVILSALEGSSFQHVPWGAAAPTGVVYLTVIYDAPRFAEVSVCDNSHAELGSWVVRSGSQTYRISGGLYDALAAVLQQYGILQK